MLDIAAGFIAFGSRLPAGNRVGICTSSGGGGAWAADACAAAGLDVPLLDAETRKRIDVYLPPYGTSQNPVDVTAQAIHERGYAEFAGLVAGSPEVDGVIVVITGRHPRFLLEDREPLMALARETEKPIFMWSYTRPADGVRRAAQRGGLSSLHQRAQLRPHDARDGGLPRRARALHARVTRKEPTWARSRISASRSPASSR